MTRYSVAVFLLLALSLTQCARAQPSLSFEGGPDASWNGKRIVKAAEAGPGQAAIAR